MSGSHSLGAKRMVLNMIRVGLGLLLALFTYVILFAVSAIFDRYPIPPATNAPLDPPGLQIRGAFHIHSTLSDGGGMPSQIARAAKDAGLQFIIMTDHNLGALSAPTFEDGVLVISGVELSTPRGHLVALGTRRGLSRDERASDPVRRIEEMGGFTFVAHPVQEKLPWTDDEAAERATGMELYSGDSLFRDALHSPFSLLLPAASAYLTNPMHGLMMLVRPQPEATAKLLAFSSREPKVALCAHDAHGRPPYELVFRAFSTHVPAQGELEAGLPKNPNDAARAIIAALARGASYCAFDALADASGFSLDGASSSRKAPVGDRLTVRLPPSSPSATRVQIWGGARVDQDGRTVVFERPGPVQIEVWLAAPGKLGGTEWKPWIVPSPILVQR